MRETKDFSDVEHSIHHLPHDLILLILSRFPIKSLVRSKSVCKSWLRSLSSPHFARLHFTSSSVNPPNLFLELPDSTNPDHNFLFVHPSDGASEFSFDFLRDRVKIRASCNGILCCASVSVRGLFYVCNPITKQFIPIPRTGDRPVTRFHPDCDSTLVGLAYDASKFKFSLVLAGFRRIFGRHHDDRFICQVFDSETNAWRRFVCQLYDEFTHMNRNQVVYSNGLLHWLTHSLCYILVLDFENEVWTKISLPDEILLRRGYGQRVYLLDYDGSVSVVQMLGSSMNIWVLKDYEMEKWILEDRVNLGCVGVFAASAFPVCQSRNMMFLATQKMILVYSRKSKEWKVVYAVNFNVTYPLWFSAHPFRSTLFPCR